MKYRAVMEIPDVCYTQWTEVSPEGIKVNIAGFKTDMGVLHQNGWCFCIQSLQKKQKKKFQETS